MRHLKLCRYLKNYDDGLIIRNLFFLFFIVVFPFSAASIGHVAPTFFLPMYIYLVNILMLTISHYLIASYALKKRPHLIIAGEEAEKKYLLIKAKLPIFMLLASLTTVSLTSILFPNNEKLIALSYQSIIVFAAILRFQLKKYNPKKTA